MAAIKSTSDKNTGRDIVEIKVVGNQNAVATQGAKATVSIPPVVQDDWKAWCEQMEGEIKALQELPAEDQPMLAQNVEQVVKEAEMGEQAGLRKET